MHSHTSSFYGDVVLVLDLPDSFYFLQYFMVPIEFLSWEGALANVTNIHTYHNNKWGN